MIDDPDDAEQDLLEEIDPDLISCTFSTRGGDQLNYFLKIIRFKDDIYCLQWRCKDRIR